MSTTSRPAQRSAIQRRRRGGAGTSSSPPARRAASLAGERQRRHAVGLVLLGVFAVCLQSRRRVLGTTAPPMAIRRRADDIRDVNIRYHDLAAERLRRQVGHRLRRGRARRRCSGKLTRRSASEPRRYGRALEIGAGTGYFTLNLLRAGRDPRGGRHGHLAGDARDAVEPPPAGSGSRSDGALRGRQAAVRGRVVRPRLRPRRPPPPARPRGRVRASSGACCDPAARWPSAASRRATATCISRPCRSAPPSRSRPLWRALMRAAPSATTAPSHDEQRGGQARVAGGRARVHARASSARSRATPASTRSG